MECTANLVLQSTVERLYVNDSYCDIPRGVFIVRGENVLLLGEIVTASRLGPFHNRYVCMVF